MENGKKYKYVEIYDEQHNIIDRVYLKSYNDIINYMQLNHSELTKRYKFSLDILKRVQNHRIRPRKKGQQVTDFISIITVESIPENYIKTSYIKAI